MKKILVFVLVACLLAGCAAPVLKGTEPTVTDAPQTEPTPAATEPTKDEPETKPTEPTAPPATKPEPTDPPATEPDPTEPPATKPQPTDPPATERPTVPPSTEPVGDVYTRAELEAMDTKVNGWGPGTHVDENNRPYGAINEQNKYGKYEAYFIAPAQGQIYLTFDEGYENGYTSQILDVLKEKDVKAVFFVTKSYCKSEPELVQRMVDEGHALGNHSVRHKSMPTLDIDTMVSEVMDLHDYVKEKFGYEMHLFRPPMGEYSQQSLAVLHSLGYKTVQWSFAYYDYDPEKQMSTDKAFKKVTDAAHEGAIYLLHAVSKTNTEILGDVIDAFRNEGYKLELFE